MGDRTTKTQRWLDLLAFLLGRRLPVTVGQIFEGVPAYGIEDPDDATDKAQAAALRTFERDKDDLRKLGIPLASIEYHVDGRPSTGYRIDRKDFYLPYLKILGEAAAGDAGVGGGSGAEGRPGTEGRTAGGRPRADDRPKQAGAGTLELSADDAGTALDALLRAESLPSYPYAREARAAFQKLSGDLDLADFAREPVVYLDAPGSKGLGDTLRDLAEALNARKRVAFRYHGIHRGEDTTRDVTPYGLVFQGGHWYLVGHDALRDGVRMLRVSRMRDIDVNEASPNSPDYEIPEDFELGAFLGREAWELGSDGEGEIVARVRFDFPLSLWADRNRRGELESERDDGSAVRRFRVRQVDPFLRWMLSFEGAARILEPAPLRAAVRRMAADVADLHERAPEEGGTAPDEGGMS